MASKGSKKNNSASTGSWGLWCFEDSDKEIDLTISNTMEEIEFYDEFDETNSEGLDQMEMWEMSIEMLKDLGYGRDEAAEVLAPCGGEFESALGLLVLGWNEESDEVTDIEDEDRDKDNRIVELVLEWDAKAEETVMDVGETMQILQK